MAPARLVRSMIPCWAFPGVKLKNTGGGTLVVAPPVVPAGRVQPAGFPVVPPVPSPSNGAIVSVVSLVFAQRKRVEKAK